MNYFAKNIELLREEKQLTKAAMLSKLDIPRTTWASYENNDAEPSIDRLLAIADFFDVNVTDLLTKDLSQQERKKTTDKQKTKGKATYQPSNTHADVKEPSYFDAPCKECRSKDAVIEAQAVTIKALQSALHQAEERLKEKAIKAAGKKKPGSPF